MNFIRNRLGTKLFHNFERSKSNFSFLISRLQIVLWIFSREETKKQRRKDGERGKKRTSVHVSALTSTRDERERYRISRGVGFPSRFSRHGDALFATFLIISSVFVARLSGMNGTLVAIRRANSSQRWFDDRGVMDRSKFSNLI